MLGSLLLGGERQSPSAAKLDLKAAALAAAVVGCLLPFLGKPFHIDDPMYVWAAQHIAEHPLDFYGFVVNWHGTATPMATVMKNPPLVSYYLAAAGSLLGWRELALHLALLLPAAGLVLGTYALAGLYTARPAQAVIAMAVTPVFLVSATTVMSDIPMLCAWVWALVFWMRGLRESSPLLLALGAALAAVAALTKYFGIGLLPLFAVYGILRERRAWRWAPWLLLPVAALVAYQLGTERLYGRGLLLDATAYASAIRARAGWQALPKLAIGLAFTGGCLATALWYGPALWSRRALLGWAAASSAAVALLAGLGSLGVHPLRDESGVRWLEVFQLGVALVAGASVVALAILDLVADRSPESVLLAAWTAGTLVFADGLNWAVNARALLPLAPAAGILIARRLERRPEKGAFPVRWTRWALVPAAALALLVAAADEAEALVSRDAAGRLAEQLSSLPGTVWFQGHWGFQYYAQRAGFLPLDYRHPAIEVGDAIIKPEGITNPIALPPGTVELTRSIELEPFPCLSTMSLAIGAGFYADVWGPLPYAFGRVPREQYRVYRALVPMKE